LVAFDRALHEVVDRQAALRTVIVARDGAHAQQILDHVDFTLLPPEDLSGLPAESREPELMGRLDALIDIPFDLARGPLFAVRLFRLAEDHHVFFFMAHHIVWDGWSFDLLYEEIAAAYGAALAGRSSPLPLPPVSYVDFAHWHNAWLASEACQAQVGYWKSRFAGAAPVREIPTDLPRRPGMSGRGATEWVHVDRALTDRLHAVARQADSTLNMAALAAYAAMLYATAQSRELTLGIPVRGRPVPELEPVMGFFNNLLPLRLSIDPAVPFTAWMSEVKRLMLEAFDHQEVPFERLVQDIDALRDVRAAGAYQALFSFQDARERIRNWGGVQQEGILVFQRGATEDLGLWLMEGPSGLEGGVTYNADLFLHETAALLQRRYVALLERVAARPNDTLAQLLDLGASEQEALALRHAVAPAASAAAPVDATAPAIRAGERAWTRAEFEQRVAAAASALTAAQPAARRVAVQCAEPLERLAASLAIVQSGRTCVISASGMPGRLFGKVDVVVGDAESRGIWPAATVIVSLPAPPDSTARPPLVAEAHGAIEIVSESGTAVVGWGALQSLARALCARLGVSPGSNWLVASTMPEPCVLLESIGALNSGACLDLAPAAIEQDGDALSALMSRTAPAVVHLPPSSWRALLDAWWSTKAPLAALLDGAEAHPELIGAVRQAGAVPWTLHRPDGLELPLALSEAPEGTGVDDLGQPLLAGTLRVVDAAGATELVGVPGRLEARFGTTGFVTTDPVRWRADGRLVAVAAVGSRRVRLNGRSIDLDAIESIGRATRGVGECIAAVQEPRPGLRRLEVYAVAAGGASIDESMLLAAIEAAQPAGTRSVALTVLNSVPRKVDGSVDRPALLTRIAGDGAARPVPSTPTELVLAEVWGALLGVQQIEMTDNFFDLGGSSLLAMQAVEQVAQRLGKRITPRRYVFESLAQIAMAYDAEEAARPVSDVPTEAPKTGLLRKLGGLLRRGA